MSRRCRNDECQFSLRCSIRDEDLATAGPGGIDTTKPPAPPARDPWQAQPVRFEVSLTDAGWIGRLTVQGKIENDIKPVVMDALGQLKTLSGLMLCIDTPGGSGRASDLLHGFAVLARVDVPVIAHVRDCMSAGVLPMVACDAAYCHHAGAVGAFGNIQSACDGVQPFSVVSRQSPRKHDGTAIDWYERIYAPTAEDVARLQSRADADYEREFAKVVRHTGADAQVLRKRLDGRFLSPQEAREAGLITGICSEDKALDKLLAMTKNNPNRKKEIAA